jgi:hypothetical protein
MTITAIAAPTALPTMRMAPRDSAAAKEVRVTIQAEIAAHQGSSECSTNAADTASDTDSTADRAATPRVPRSSNERNSVASAPVSSRNVVSFSKRLSYARRNPYAA